MPVSIGQSTPEPVQVDHNTVLMLDAMQVATDALSTALSFGDHVLAADNIEPDTINALYNLADKVDNWQGDVAADLTDAGYTLDTESPCTVDVYRHNGCGKVWRVASAVHAELVLMLWPDLDLLAMWREVAADCYAPDMDHIVTLSGRAPDFDTD